MATGVPKRRAQSNSGSMHLEYSTKQQRNAILDTPLPDLEMMWQGPRSCDNRLYFGENLGVLAALLDDQQISGKVKLVYIDPPFATQTVFHSRALKHAYEDTLSGADFVEFLRARLILLRELLADDGSLYLHLDAKMLFHVKVILDEIFGAENFRNCITRKKCNPKNYTRRQYGNISDYVLFYTKTKTPIWNRPTEPWTEERAKEYQYIEPGTGRRFMKVPIHAPGVRNGATGQPWRGMSPPPGKHWQFKPEKLEGMDERGEIFWSSNGNPRRKVYLDESPGIGVQDIWLDYRDAHNQNVCITGYPTEKNPEMLKRIVEASSNGGDLVLDCFAGSGTTLAVASELGRRWIGVDSSAEAIDTTLTRFAHGTKPMGDFVNRRRGAARSKSSPAQHQFPFAANNGTGITQDFALIAQVDMQGDLASTLEGWKEKVEYQEIKNAECV